MWTAPLASGQKRTPSAAAHDGMLLFVRAVAAAAGESEASPGSDGTETIRGMPESLKISSATGTGVRSLIRRTTGAMNAGST
jgi:hypothetical protein